MNLYIEYLPLSHLISAMDAANPKDHDLGAIHASMDKFGFVETPYLNETTGRIIAGHGRIETLMQKKQSRMAAPERIEVRPDDWYVPVTRGIAFATDSEARAYLIASNRITELGGWNESDLAEMLEGIRSEDESLMQAAGYTDEDLETLLRDLGREMDAPQDAGAQLDKAAELQEKWQIQTGQVWEIPSKTVAGKAHRLICGDCADGNVVKSLLNGKSAKMVWTDPPYGMSLDTDFSGMESRLFKGKTGSNYHAPVIGDDKPFDPGHIFTTFGNAQEIFLWGADYYSENIPNKNSGSWIVWDKRLDESADKMWGSSFELCWSKQPHKRDIARIKWAGIFGMEKQDTGARIHPTQKPVELPVWFFERWSAYGSLIVDIYLGSGTTMVAAEQTGRLCYGCEIEPKYCAVILDRMERMGLSPRLVETELNGTP